MLLDIMLNTEHLEGDDFNDVGIKEDSDYHYFKIVKNAGIMEGKPGNLFAPDDYLNRAELAKIITRLFINPNDPNDNNLALCDVNDLPFSDVEHDNSGNGWYCKYVKKLAEERVTTGEGIISGYPDDTYKPAEIVNKAEITKFFINGLDYYLSHYSEQARSQNELTNTVGKKYELTAQTYGANPTLQLLDYSSEIADNQTLVFEYNNSNNIYNQPLFFYWSSNASIASDASNHRRIIFTPPTVSEPTDFELYTWVGSHQGKVREETITITVCPSSNCTPSNDGQDLSYSQETLTFEDTWILLSKEKFWTVTNQSNQNATIKGENGSEAIYSYHSGGPWENFTTQYCIISGNDGGIIMQNLNNPQFVNNVVAYDNGFNTINVFGSTTGAVIKNNIFYQNNAGITLNGVNTSYTHNCLHQSNAGDHNTTDNNITSNPNFVNPGVGNYKLQSSSPCLNTGTDVSLPFSETAPERGAEEYNAKGNLSISSNLDASFTLIRPDGSSQANVPFDYSQVDLDIGIYQVFLTDYPEYETPPTQFIYLWPSQNNALDFTYAPDVTGPEVILKVAEGNKIVSSPTVSLFIGAEEIIKGFGTTTPQMQFSNDGVSWSFPEDYISKKHNWSLIDFGGNTNEGLKTIYARVSDNLGNWSEITTASLEYKPTGNIHRLATGTELSFGLMSSFQSGDIILLENGTYLMSSYYFPSNIKVQGNENTIIQLGTSPDVETNVHIDHIYFMCEGNAFYLQEGKSLFTNCTFDNLEEIAVSRASSRPVFFNCIFQNLNTDQTTGVFINAYNHNGLEVRNCIFDGTADNNAFFIKQGIQVDPFNANHESPVIVSNIFIGFDHSHTESGAIYINNTAGNLGTATISHNNFFNTTVDIVANDAAPTNQSPFYLDPQFIPGTYQLSENSSLRNISFPNTFYSNHGKLGGELGIEGGLFFNHFPEVTINVTPEEGSINTTFSFSATGTDLETWSDRLRYCWDLDDDGVCDTDISTSPVLEYQFDNYDNPSVTCFIFDEHFAINYATIPNPVSSPPTSLPGIPVLTFPENMAILNLENDNIFSWEAVEGFDIIYQIEVATDMSFTSVVFQENSLSTNEIMIDNLPYSPTYYWRVNATNEVGTGEWSNVWQFNADPTCQINNFTYSTNPLPSNQFEIVINFEGSNLYSLTDGITPLQQQNSGSFNFGPYPMGANVSISVLDEIADNCIESTPYLTIQPPLSQDLLVFEAKTFGQSNVLLEWIYYRAEKVNFFEIQKYAKSSEWKSIGKVESANVVSNKFFFMDDKAFNEAGVTECYYRLKLYHKDDTYFYSPIRSILIQKTIPFQLYPNPTSNQITFSLTEALNGSGTIHLYNNLGQQVLQRQISTHDLQTTLDLSSLATGFYFLHFQTPNQHWETKILKQ